MRNYSYKFVKPLTSLVLGATLLTSAVIAPITSAEAAVSSSYKITKGKLVSKSTSKIVKGFKTYKGKVYKDGKLLTGLKSGVYYKKGVKSTGWYKGKWYEKGKALTGFGKNTSKLYINGKPAMGNWYKGKWYENGKALTGLGKNTGNLYVNGVLNTGKYLYKNKLYDGAVLNKGLKLYGDKLYSGAALNQGLILFEGKLYNGTALNQGLTLFENKLYNNAALNVGIVQYGGKWYNGSGLASGTITTPDGKTIQVENGVESKPGNGSSSGNNGGTSDHAPTASSVKIVGAAKVGVTLEVTYTYTDIDKDVEKGTTFQWYADGKAIIGATTSTFKLTTDHVGKVISVQVTPKNDKAIGNAVTATLPNVVVTPQ
ncbi:hypothetical protein [Viridibacillus arvi]|uniref:Ig-like domain-containing protein n=1 Tax=Viridibacillus arvi TaxID=263475 RepID=A0A0M0L9X4_9BACL|nr:hypothetical protein [Viridibacillus arvi]KOO47896.1 hypothetical protein AMD00_19900 [Viridibacillus arvi]